MTLHRPKITCRCQNIHISVETENISTEILFITEMSAVIIAACQCMWHMTDSTMQSLCWLQVFSDV